MSEIRLDGDAAVVGGVHSDSHDVTHNVTHNETHNVTNSQTIVEAQKTDSQFRFENEQLFLQAVSERIKDGILDQRELAELNQLRLYYQIPLDKANAIIDQARKNAALISADISNDFLSEQLLDEIYHAIMENREEILKRKFSSLEKLAKISSDPNVQFYYHLLLASLDPVKCEMTLLQSVSDNYWQLYWAHIAYIKNGNIEKAEALMPKLGAFGAPKGDISLLLAADATYDFLNQKENKHYLQQVIKHLENATNHGISEGLSPLWYGIDYIVNKNKGSQPEKWYEFIVNTTLKSFKSEPVNQRLGSPSLPPSPPPMPKFNPQAVNLTQMQGFNPLEAAKQMNLGQISQMPQMPQMGGMGKVPPMPQQGFIPPMPSSAPSGMAPKINTQGTPPFPGVGNSFHQKNEGNNSEDSSDPYKDLYGIIMTDTEILARKYSISREEVIGIFADFTDKAEEQLMHWAFLDVSDWSNSMPTETWLDYNNLVSTFIQEYNLEAGPKLHLMIVGGADVIPVPEIEDPFGSSDTGMLPTDTCYSFEGTFIEDFAKGADLQFKYENARNNVSRLPLESGRISSDIRGDLGAYFNLCSLYGGGIPVRRVVMLSHQEWLPASATMSQHLPLICNENASEIVNNRMYVSPNLYTSDPSTLSIYESSIENADMLMFNLHGASSPDMPGFYSHDEAFNSTLLNKSNARVFNTVACYGARYYGYKREESMVLSSLYGGGILLYTGSLIPVPMYHSDETRELLLHPGTGSEVFMRLLPLYQLKGMTAGEALLKAKCDYFNMMRHAENDDFSLATALMFCTYGNPMLHVKENRQALEAARSNSIIPVADVKANGGPVKVILKQRVMEKNQDGSSLLDTIRGYVDQNLSAIRNYVEHYVHQSLGLPPQFLDSIDAISRPLGNGNYFPGYYFNYTDPTAKFSPRTRVEIDAQGAIKRIYTTK